MNQLKYTSAFQALKRITNKKIIVIDGAMGTELQKFKLKNKHYKTFIEIKTKINQKGNNDILNISQPRIISKIHEKYIKAGADIIETNTFSANSISQTDYNTQKHIHIINKHAMLIAKHTSLKFGFKLMKRIFIAAAVGPTNKSASISSNVQRPANRSITFNELKDAYKEQISTLIKYKADLINIETIFDTINAKAAIYAYFETCESTTKWHPLMLSCTISDQSGRILSGQTLEAFYHSIIHANPFSIGLNCSLGAKQMIKYLRVLSKMSTTLTCIYPNAGLPDAFGRYQETPNEFTNNLKKCIEDNVVNIVGGCCGSTSTHIKKLKQYIKHKLPRKRTNEANELLLAGLETLKVERNKFYQIGERANVTGSTKFKSLIRKGKHEEASESVRKQIINGAKIIDINMDDSLLQSEKEMKTFINTIMSEPDISKIPLMIDSSKWEILIAGLKCAQGKSIVNSISLKEGQNSFLLKAKTIKQYGGIPVIIAFDETGQAISIEHKLKICKRAYRLLMRTYKSHEIIFDLNTFAIATGLPEHAKCAINLLKSIKIVSFLYPNVNLIAGISNLSFSFRGNDSIRECLHSVFLSYATKAGLNLGIVNVNSKINIAQIDAKTKKICKTLLFNEKAVSINEIIALKPDTLNKQLTQECWRHWKPTLRLSHSVIAGIDKYIKQDTLHLLKTMSPIQIIEKPLMIGMDTVGKLFAKGKMFLPQVVKSARIMKKAVEIIKPFMKKAFNKFKKTILLATVKGDVHDIGKNIVAIVLSCNNYKIIDLGIMVSADKIINTAKTSKVDIIGLSGLITPSLEEMLIVAAKLQNENFNIPLLIGGATTSKIHTALRISNAYKKGVVVHVNDASKAVIVASTLFSTSKDTYINNIKTEYKIISKLYKKSKKSQNKISLNKITKYKIDKNYTLTKHPTFLGKRSIVITNICDLVNSIDWNAHATSWNIKKLFQASELNKTVFEKWIAFATKKLTNLIKTESWFSLRCCIGIYKAYSVNNNIYILNKNNKILEIINNLMQQQKNCYQYSMSNFLGSKNDYITMLNCNVGYEAKIIQNLLRRKNRHCYTILFKSICDKLIEKVCESTYFNIKHSIWGFIDKHSEIYLEGKRGGIRPAPGYSCCPDHYNKIKILKLLDSSKNTGVILNNKYVMIPTCSIACFIIANEEANYLDIKNINLDQAISYSKNTKMSLKTTENRLISLIGYLPKQIETTN